MCYICGDLRGAVLVSKLNNNSVNERFKYQCSIDVKNTTFRAYTRYQVDEYAGNVAFLTSMLHWYLNLSFTLSFFNLQRYKLTVTIFVLSNEI